MRAKVQQIYIKGTTNLYNKVNKTYRWVLLISFVRFRDYLRGQIASERRSYAGITTERTDNLSRRESERWQNVTHDFMI